jgi:NAD(P)H dehydrogenase (quinone)
MEGKMAKILIGYYSVSGNTQKMAVLIKEAFEKLGINPDFKKIEEIRPENLLDYEGIIIGSPTYYGSMSWNIKKLFDDSVRFHGQLEGKVGAAFSSSANIAGGNETAILDILHAMLIHGMIVKGCPSGDHYGPVGINKPDERTKVQCVKFAEDITDLVNKLF